MKDANDVMIKIYLRIYNELIVEIVDLLADGVPNGESEFMTILSLIASKKQENILDALNKKEEEKNETH